MVSLGNHSSNSKSSSNLTGSSHSSRHGERQRDNTPNSQVIYYFYLIYVDLFYNLSTFSSQCRLLNNYNNVHVVVKHGH